MDLSVLLFYLKLGLSWGNCFALIDIFRDCFFVCIYCMVVIWKSPFFVFVLFEQLAFVIIFIVWCVFKIHFKVDTFKKVI